MTQIATIEPAHIVQQAPTPMTLLSQAVAAGASIDTIERLSALAEKMMQRDAEVAFNKSMHLAQQEMRRIGADAVNPQTRSKYATYTKMDAALRPIYSKHGFSLRFKTADSPKPDHVRVVGILSHIDGHSDESFVDMPADGKGAKGNDVMTKTHAAGSALSYGERYLLKMIFNVAVGETDDDGNGGGGSIEEGTLCDFLDSIRASSTVDELKKRFFAAREAAQKSKDREAEEKFIAEKDLRYRQLQGGAA